MANTFHTWREKVSGQRQGGAGTGIWIIKVVPKENAGLKTQVGKIIVANDFL